MLPPLPPLPLAATANLLSERALLVDEQRLSLLRPLLSEQKEAKMLAKVALLLLILDFSLQLVTPTPLEHPQTLCSESYSLLEYPGNVILSVFVDANSGPNCNDSSIQGYEKIFTALYVAETLNKQDYLPGLTLGLKIYDTCNDPLRVYKETLRLSVESECVEYYDLGVLAPWDYRGILEPLRNSSVHSISLYKDEDMSRALVNLLVQFLSTRFERVDLAMATTQEILDYFMLGSKEAGICVKSAGDVSRIDRNVTEAVIGLIGTRQDIARWIKGGEKIDGPRKTWVVLDIDGSNVDELVPPGSYIINAVPFDFDVLQELGRLDNLAEIASSSVIRSPHVLGIGKAILQLAGHLQDLQLRACPQESNCTLPRFNPRGMQELRKQQVYENLRTLPKHRRIKYRVGMRLGPKDKEAYVQVATFGLEPSKLGPIPDQRLPKMPRLCINKLINNCAKCDNFLWQRSNLLSGILEKGVLKAGNWVPILLTIEACGTLACTMILLFILYRYLLESSILDGSPILTIVLILSTMFTLQTVLPFCMEDDYFGSEHLNSRKILVTTLAFGLDFSIMMARAIFLAFSTEGVFSTHINGYLLSLMIFFMLGVQLAISITYFALASPDSASTLRSMLYIALLSFFAVCCFIAQLQRNYYEGKCFFATAIALLIAWTVWLTCFILMEPNVRDLVVCSGIVATSYLIIIGVLIPRTYFMTASLTRSRISKYTIDPADYGLDHRINAVARQYRPYYDYIHPGRPGTVNISSLRVPPVYPNYYGSASPESRYPRRAPSPDPRRSPGYNNYGYNAEMKEMENSPYYMTPRVRIEDADNSPGPRSEHARPRSKRRRRVVVAEKDCIETDVYVEGRLSPNRRTRDESYPSRSPSPKLGPMEKPIKEVEEDNLSRVTRF
ncbi:uncharacterized protein boss isoform X2 [Prorops nasuta]|uniref:uncharacterized protein boss isoform X2 n=1 Tax=Prorops nasuta TaxID=863751 RepID=UPI0034CFF754